MEAILAMAAVTFALRAFPFHIAGRWKDSAIVRMMGRFLPPAIMLILVAYSFNGVQWATWPSGVPELLAVTAVVILHVLFRNPFVSIVAGTVLYVIARPLLASMSI
jgi:branched-subunit amino acid transport protein AzlD